MSDRRVRLFLQSVTPENLGKGMVEGVADQIGGIFHF